jgi:hypothetical protein
MNRHSDGGGAVSECRPAGTSFPGMLGFIMFDRAIDQLNQ